MKRLSLNFLIAIGLTLVFLAFTFIKEAGIQGKVSPVGGAAQVFAVLGTDTLKTDVNNGRFAFGAIKTGTYTIWVKANSPYKDKLIEHVAVIDSTITDVGEIKLQQ